MTTALPEPVVATPATSLWWEQWWPVFAVCGAGVAVGGVIVHKKRKQAKAAKAVAAAASTPTTPGEATLRRVLTQGILDGELKFDRSNLRDMLYFHKTFREARNFGISPTDLATTGRYFGEEVLPIKVGIYADGSMQLLDGRKRYTASKEQGAKSIMADVLLHDKNGEVLAEQRTTLKLV